MSMPLLRPTFWSLGSPLAQRAPSRMYPASRSTPCPAGPGLPGFLTRRSASLCACCLSLLGMPSGSLHEGNQRHARICFPQGRFPGHLQWAEGTQVPDQALCQPQRLLPQPAGRDTGSLHAHRAASSHSATQCPIPHGSFWGVGKVLPADCGERGS